MGKVENYIKDGIAKKGGLLFALIDPVDYKAPSDAISAGTAAGGLMSSIGIAAPLPFDAESIRQLTLDRAYSTERAHRELGFKAKVKLAAGIKQMAAEYRAKKGKGA